MEVRWTQALASLDSRPAAINWGGRHSLPTAMWSKATMKTLAARAAEAIEARPAGGVEQG
jgi:hypothetical protein